VTSVEGTPKRIDDGWLGVGVVNPDVSPDGEIIVFEFNERLWAMDIQGREHKELVSGPMRYRFPAWSPDGDYVAFLAMAGNAHSEVDRALHFINMRNGKFERVDLSAFGGPLNHVPFGPLSWTR
jgi:Tol biopolymer transport system component